jgi:hypothetical protein
MRNKGFIRTELSDSMFRRSFDRRPSCRRLCRLRALSTIQRVRTLHARRD